MYQEDSLHHYNTTYECPMAFLFDLSPIRFYIFKGLIKTTELLKKIPTVFIDTFTVRLAVIFYCRKINLL